jgi:Domain of unknown function (DUF4440)
MFRIKIIQTVFLMKNIIFALFSCLSMATYAQTDEIEILERQRFAAQVNKDMDVLQKIFGEDLLYTHSGGSTDNKESYLLSIKNGKSRYDNIDVEKIGVKYFNRNKTAQVNGQITIRNEGSPPNHLKYAVLYIKKPKLGWQLVMWQSLKLAN